MLVEELASGGNYFLKFPAYDADGSGVVVLTTSTWQLEDRTGATVRSGVCTVENADIGPDGGVRQTVEVKLDLRAVAGVDFVSGKYVLAVQAVEFGGGKATLRVSVVVADGKS